MRLCSTSVRCRVALLACPAVLFCAKLFPMTHRKAVKHYEANRCFHELTFSCFHRKPLLTNDVWQSMLAVSISRATLNHRYDLVAFVFMPEHLHLLVLPHDVDCRVSGLLKAMKRPFSYRIKKLLEAAKSPLLGQLTVRQRPGVQTFRFWQEGPGYDRNIESDAAIRSAIDYIHMNPVRRGLCERKTDWGWSSARFYSDQNFPLDDALPRIDGLKVIID